jgi:uncharacterized protein (DUF4415 family)
MTDLKHQNAAQTKHYTYMSDVMRRLEWDLHNTIELTGRIPEEWHQIASATPEAAGVKVNLRLEADVVKFFKSMGEGYGPRINAVLKSYMHARLAGVIKGAETLAHYRKREELHEGAKPAFGETARSLGETWEDEGPAPEAKTRARMAEILQQRHAEEGMKGEPEGWFRVR